MKQPIHLHHLLTSAPKLACHTKWVISHGNIPSFEPCVWTDLWRKGADLAEGAVPHPPPKKPRLVCSVKWHKPATSSEASAAALQPAEREAHLFIFCSSGRGLHSWSCKGHRTGPPLVITVPCDPPGGKSESICSLSPIQQGVCHLRGRVYINSDLNICMHMSHL